MYAFLKRSRQNFADAMYNQKIMTPQIQPTSVAH